MDTNTKAAFGIFHQKSEVSAAKRLLRLKGFAISKIEVMYPRLLQPEEPSKQAQTMIRGGALMGALAGGIIFMIFAMLVVMQKIPIPSFGGNFWQGHDQVIFVLVTLILGTGVGAAAGALVGIGTPVRVGERFGNSVSSGDILMSVQVETDDEVRAAQAALEKTGAQDITLLGENQGWRSVYSNLLKAK